jgi:hypothetical protein
VLPVPLFFSPLVYFQVHHLYFLTDTQTFSQNGHKHWISGWFRSRSAIVYPWNGPVERRLVSFVHYSDDDQMYDDDVVLIRVGNLYIQYNRAKRYNIDADMPDTVTITHAVTDEDVSDRLSVLSHGEKFAYETFDEQNHILVIQVCSMVIADTSQIDYAIVRIYYDDGNPNVSTCNDGYVPQPSASNNDGETSTNNPSVSNDNGIHHEDPIVDLDGKNIETNNNNSKPSNDDTSNKNGMIYVLILSVIATILSVSVVYWITKKYCHRIVVPQTKPITNKKYSTKTTSTNGKRNVNGDEELDETAQEDDEDPIDLVEV